MNEYIDYYQGEYRNALPDEVQGNDETVAYLTDIQQELLHRLDTSIEGHDQLEPALENAVAQGAIPPEDLDDLAAYVLATDRWLSLQERIAEGGLECIHDTPNEIDRIQLCSLKLAVAKQARSDELATQIDELAGWLFGTS